MQSVLKRYLDEDGLNKLGNFMKGKTISERKSTIVDIFVERDNDHSIKDLGNFYFLREDGNSVHEFCEVCVSFRNFLRKLAKKENYDRRGVMARKMVELTGN